MHLARSRYEVVETYGRRANWSVRLFSPRLSPWSKIVSLTTSPKVPQSFLGQRMERWTGRSVSRYVSNSQAGRRALLSIGVESHKIRVIPNGVDWRSFDLRAGRAEVRASVRHQLDIPMDAWLVVCVANFRSMKGHDLLLKAARQLVAQHPDVHLMLVGGGPKLVPTRERVLADATLRHAVHFLGVRERIPELLAAADVSVLASKWEGMPGSVMEAMAAGLPIVATRVGGVPELIDHRRTGLLVEPETVSDLVTALGALHEDSQLAACLGRAARCAVRTWTVERQVEDWLDLYRELGALDARQPVAAGAGDSRLAYPG
jgi:glycosyltransferase involved in cell wall biosynthesis